MDADVIVVGGGLAGLVASNELVRAGKRVVILEQENAANLGGQAFWSLGGIFMVDTPMQRSARREGLVRARVAGLVGIGAVGPAAGRASGRRVGARMGPRVRRVRRR